MAYQPYLQKLRVKNRAQAVLKAKEIEMVQENEQ